jgi:UDP-2,3-diacylglucosamine hydrolase
MPTFFISDLHLNPERPDILRAFRDFMHQKAIHADALYVLGDLFDFWISDSDPTDFAQAIKHEFKQLTTAGVPCYFIHGNRDFLLGRRFSRETGVVLLAEHTVIDLYGQRVLILHGDTLCLDDVRYLQFRQKIRRPWLQHLFYWLPFSLKRHIVRRIQTNVRTDKQSKASVIMDVTQQEVERMMDHYQVDVMIHGHTHRPNIHHFHNNGKIEKKRIVLGDWDQEISVLQYDRDKNYCLYHQLI